MENPHEFISSFRPLLRYGASGSERGLAVGAARALVVGALQISGEKKFGRLGKKGATGGQQQEQ